MARQISLTTSFPFCTLLTLVACAGSDASYTRWRGESTRGHMVRAEEVRASELIGEAAVRLYELSAPSAAAGASEALHVRVSLQPAEPNDAAAAPVIAAQRIVVTRDGAVPYDPAPGGAVLRNLALGRTAVALRDADLRQRGGDVGGALIALDAHLAFARAARARLVAAADETRAATLDEPLALLVRTRELVAAGVRSTPAPAAEESAAAGLAPLTSTAYAGWGVRGTYAGDD